MKLSDIQNKIDANSIYNIKPANEIVGANTTIANNLGSNYGGMVDPTTNAYVGTDNSLLNQVGVPTNIAIDNATLASNGLKPETNWYDGFSKDGGLLGASQVGLGIGQLGLGVMQYLDAEKTGKLNRELLNQQIANNQDTMATRLARREQIAKTWGPQANAGLGTLAAPTENRGL